MQLNGHLYKHKDYEVMRPRSNQPGHFFATVKIHKFESVEDIYLESLKLRPIIDQTGTIFTILHKSWP